MKKPFIEVCRGGHKITIVRTFKTCSLYIDGTEVDVYHGVVEIPYVLKGNVEQDVITAREEMTFCCGVIKLFYNDELIAKKFHL